MKTEIQGLLKQSAIFAALDDDERRTLADLAQEKSLVQDENIFWEGDAAEWFLYYQPGQGQDF